MFQDGDLVRTVNIPVPPAVLAKAREPLCKASAQSALPADAAPAGAAADDDFGIEASDDAAAVQS
jgi:glutamine amidotransferase